MDHVNYPEWAGRFRAVIRSLLETEGDEIATRLAREACAEFDQLDRPQMFSALGDHRERAVPCLYCRRDTWTIEPVCDRCREAAADVRATGEAS